MRKFFKKDDGLVTIEWIGIAAVMLVAAVGIAVTVMTGADTAGGKLGTNVGTMVDNAQPSDTAFSPFTD
ncbi:MAG: hypothetical protein AB7P23_04235 [Amphiplicatus sp.]